MFWGFPNGVTMAAEVRRERLQREDGGHEPWLAGLDKGGHRERQHDDKRDVVRKRHRKRGRDEHERHRQLARTSEARDAARAAQSKTPAFRNALATASTQNRHPMVFQSK